MPQRCNPHIVKTIYLQVRSWRKAARTLNDQYGVSLSHTTWRDYSIGKYDIAGPEIRARLLLPPRACPSCGHKHAARKPAKPRQIRVYGYPVEKAKTFVEAIELHNAPR